MDAYLTLALLLYISFADRQKLFIEKKTRRHGSLNKRASYAQLACWDQIMRGHRCISDFNTSESWIIHNLHNLIRATVQVMVTLPSSSSWIKWCAKLAVGRVLTTTRTRRLRTPADTDAPPDIVFSWLSYYGDHVGGAYLSHDIRGVVGSTRC